MNNKQKLTEILKLIQSINAGDFSEKKIEVKDAFIKPILEELHILNKKINKTSSILNKTNEDIFELSQKLTYIIVMLQESSKIVLHFEDKILALCNKLEESESIDKSSIKKIKKWSLEVISNKSQQIDSHQELEKIKTEFTDIEDTILKVLKLLNYNTKNIRPSLKQNVARKNKSSSNKYQKQDLLDELLAEFGL